MTFDDFMGFFRSSQSDQPIKPLYSEKPIFYLVQVRKTYPRGYSLTPQVCCYSIPAVRRKNRGSYVPMRSIGFEIVQRHQQPA